MIMIGKHHLISMILGASVVLGGCAGAQKPVETSSRLGSVIVYRNGVAYFERYAEADEREVSMRVPTERVDDFLKSLSVVDEKTGEALPISYPTMETYDGYVEMKIALPEQHGRLRITYVTESPSWKPSYRIVLDKDGKARLQGWAVVDNVSGEDWKNIRVGVGSTSALSFRYDLHSIRLVERAVLATDDRYAHAPPMGGSPYSVATKKVRVLDNIGIAELDVLEGHVMAGERLTATVQGESTGGVEDKRVAGKTPKQQAQSQPRSARFKNDKYLEQLRLEAGNHRVRIEGYAQSGDVDKDQASHDRAQRVANRLIELGVPADNLEVVGTGIVNDREAVRVLADEEAQGAERVVEERAPRDTLPVGQAHFISDEPMSIAKEHSAMVSTLNAITAAERVYFYDPVSDRGSKKFAFNAVRIENPSEFTLDAGPFTVYANGQFLGEGLSEAILPKATAFIPYALDRSIVADSEADTREEIEELLTIQRGIVTTETRRLRRTRLTLSNRGKENATIYVRHQVQKGYELTKKSAEARSELEKLGGAHLFSVAVKAGEAVELVIEEWTPLMKTVDIRTDGGVRDIGLFLRQKDIAPDLAEKLKLIIERHKAAENLEEKIALVEDQLVVYRTRIDEINIQLATLKTVRGAEKLRRHLSDKMEEISNKLQASTLELTELKGDLMTERIALQDRLAELTLEKKKASPKELAVN
jgi:hypothetical protein